MPTLRHNDASRSPESSTTGQPPSRQRSRAVSDADSLDQRIADLVLSNVLPPAPPEAPSLYDRTNEHYRHVRNIHRRIRREILAVNRLIRESQHVALGRDLSLLVQLNGYSQLRSELRMRRARVRDWMAENPDIDLNEFVDSSDDEDLLLGRDPAPILDYSSDSDGPEEVRFHIGEEHHAPTIALRTADIDTYLRDPYRQRRARQAGRARGQRGTQGPEISNLERDPEDADESDLEESSHADTEEFESEGEPESTSSESEEDMASGSVYEDSPASNGESAQFEEDEEGSSAPTQSEAEENDDSEQPHGWQTFHQYFMYSCRGDLAAVTSQLQGQFDFVPEITQTWVGRQLNNTLYIGEQTQFLAVYLPGETGTQDRVIARWQMALADFFIQDTYDGINAGQIVDIDLTSEAYAEPRRPVDLPPEWTPLLDAILLAALPEIPSMETFWLENRDLFQEDWQDGIGASRREHAISLRCGQLRYLRLSEDQMAAGRERERARLEARPDASASNAETVEEATL